MTDFLEMQFSGLEDLQEDLKTLSTALQDKAVTSALKAGANPIAQKMRALAPDDSRTAGTRLGRAVNITMAKNNSKVSTGLGRRSVSLAQGEQGIVVGPNKKVDGKPYQWLATILEGGTKPHTLGKPGRFIRVGGTYVWGRVKHPGTRPTMWMSKSFEGADEAFQTNFYNGLAKFLDKNA